MGSEVVPKDEFGIDIFEYAEWGMPTLAEGSDYRRLRECIDNHLSPQDDDIAEVAILMQAVKDAGKEIVTLRAERDALREAAKQAQRWLALYGRPNREYPVVTAALDAALAAATDADTRTIPAPCPHTRTDTRTAADAAAPRREAEAAVIAQLESMTHTLEDAWERLCQEPDESELRGILTETVDAQITRLNGLVTDALMATRAAGGNDGD